MAGVVWVYILTDLYLIFPDKPADSLSLSHNPYTHTHTHTHAHRHTHTHAHTHTHTRTQTHTRARTHTRTHTHTHTHTDTHACTHTHTHTHTHVHTHPFSILRRRFYSLHSFCWSTNMLTTIHAHHTHTQRCAQTQCTWMASCCDLGH